MTHPKLTLEKRIEAELKSYDGHMSVYADDLRGNVIAIDADEKFETASTIKTYILACLFDRIGKGKASLTDELVYRKDEFVEGSGVFRDLAFGTAMPVFNVATLMIIVSDNIATNMMIDYLGQDTINECIQALGCRDTVLHNPIHFDRYRQLGTTTPRDYGSMFARMARGELISPEADRQMLAIFRRQHYNSMLTRDLPPWFLDSEDTGEEELIYVASKSGSMDACRSDGGLVHTPYGDYTVVLMNKDFSDRLYYNDHPAYIYGGRVSRLLFDQYLALEGRFRL
ncbi:MAG: serine hydrolase [Oscillospiraceae bacterium]|nr:serine hydrolase [Oscillospiraceae bacterium]